MQNITISRKAIICLIILCSGLSNVSCTQMIVAASGNKAVDRDHNKRTLGARIEDRSIKYKALINLKNSGLALDSSRLIITSYNGTVLISGQTTSAELKKKSGEIVTNIRHVKRMHNGLELSKPVSFLTKAKDLWITSKIKLALMFNGHLSAQHIKIVTENGKVYIMGLITYAEEDVALKQIRSVNGVKSIVKLSEYLFKSTE